MTAATKTATEGITELTSGVPVLAKKFRDQLASNLHQGQQLSVDVAHTWANAVSALPMVELPKLPGLPVLADVEAATKYSFDIAADLLGAQREFALQVASAFVPAKKA